MLKFLDVSQSGYHSFLNRRLSSRKETITKSIHFIYNASKQNYGAHKITKKLRKLCKTIAECTVDKYMRALNLLYHGKNS